MRIISAYSRSRVLICTAALLALAILPAAASAAPKKVQFRFSATAYSVTEANTTFNVTVLRTGNKRISASVNYDVDPATTATGYSLNPTAPSTLTFAPGETQKTIAVTISDNSTFDPPNKKIVFKLSDPSPGLIPNGQSKATLTIIDNDGPGTIDFSSASYSVVESAVVATVTVTRNGNPLLSETVDYATADGSATAGSDYAASMSTITFGVGETSKTFQVPVTDDQDFEGDEALSLTLSNPQNLTNPAEPPTIGPNSPATLTIADDDVPTFSFSDSTYSADEGDGTKTITVIRGGATYVAASIGYRVDPATPGTATGSGTDYTLASGTLDFAAGETSKTFAVAITDDSDATEGNETVNLQLTQGSAVVDAAQLSIVDDDNLLPSVQFANPTYTVDEDATTATLTVTLSRAADADVTVGYATANGTATAGATEDYASTSGTLTFTAGQVSKTIDVPLHPDTDVEDDEDFSISLSSPSGALMGDPNTTAVTIVDDDDFGSLEFSAQRYDVNETAGHVTITVNRSGGSGGAVSVDYATSDGTAGAPGDYTAASGTLHFGAGETQKTFEIPVAWDGRQEGDETVSIDLSNAADGADLGSRTAAVLHIGDDGASGPVQFSAGSYDVSETAGSATITVTRSGGSLGGPATVDYATADGTAHAGSDYSERHGTLTFGPGETSKAFQIPVVNDSIRQGGRTANVALSNPGGGTARGSQASAVLNIGDDEPVSSASTDRTAPKLKLSAKKLQKVLKTKRLVLKVRSNEAATLAVTVKARKSATSTKLVSVTKSSKGVAAGKTVMIKIKLSKKAIAKLRKALVKGKAKITVAVTGTDAAGNKATVRRTITIK